MVDWRAIEPDLAAEPAVDAEHRPGELAAAGADQPGKAQDLAAAQRQADRPAGIGGGAQPLQRKHVRPGSRAGGR